jgi:PIN domain nuclease of toxin-antitoxin system
VRLLLDKHALLWWLDDAPGLSASARAVIASGSNVVFISAATIWEVRMKQAIGKLQVSEDFQTSWRSKARLSRHHGEPRACT